MFLEMDSSHRNDLTSEDPQSFSSGLETMTEWSGVEIPAGNASFS